jgi:hypothetical protein
MGKQLDEMDEVEREEYYERQRAYADFRRKEIKENEMIRSMEGTEGQDRESYSDTQDRENYTADEGYDCPIHGPQDTDDCPRC